MELKYRKYDNPEFTKQRYLSNLLILNEISACVNKYPDMRFMQILYNLNIMPKDNEDLWNEEPQKTIEKIRTI